MTTSYTNSLSPRERFRFTAQFSEQAGLFADMLDAMKNLLALTSTLTVEERELLAVAYTGVTQPRRTAWQALTKLIAKEEQKGNTEQLALLRRRCASLETELSQIYQEIINFIDTKLVPSGDFEADVFYLTMKGNYYAHICEYTSGADQFAARDKSTKAYMAGQIIAEKNLSATHPVRLSVIFRFAELYYNYFGDPAKAHSVAKLAFDDAIADIDKCLEEHYNLSTSIMDKMRDRMTVWKSELESSEIIDEESGS